MSVMSANDGLANFLCALVMLSVLGGCHRAKEPEAPLQSEHEIAAALAEKNRCEILDAAAEKAYLAKHGPPPPNGLPPNRYYPAGTSGLVSGECSHFMPWAEKLPSKIPLQNRREATSVVGSGYQAGYDWALAQGTTDLQECLNASLSFEQGCRDAVTEMQ